MTLLLLYYIDRQAHVRSASSTIIFCITFSKFRPGAAE